MPAPPRVEDDVVERLRAKLTTYFGEVVEEIGHVTVGPVHALAFLRYLKQSLNRLAHARAVIGEPADGVARVMREAELISLRNPERLRETSGRMELARAWLDLLNEAAEHVEREDQWADRYASETDEEHSLAQAGSRTAERRWRDL